MFFQKKEVALKIFRGEAIRGWWPPGTGEAGRLRQVRRQPRCPGFGQGRRPTGREGLFYCLNRSSSESLREISSSPRRTAVRVGGLGRPYPEDEVLARSSSAHLNRGDGNSRRRLQPEPLFSATVPGPAAPRRLCHPCHLCPPCHRRRAGSNARPGSGRAAGPLSRRCRSPPACPDRRRTRRPA